MSATYLPARISNVLDDVIRELRYCQWAGWAWHYANGRPARAQDEALRRGWLAPCPDPQRLRLTPIGREQILRRRESA